MVEEKFKILLRIFHPSIDPNEITEQISIIPSHAWRAGEKAKTPSGRMLNHSRELSYWCSTLPNATERLAENIQNACNMLSNHDTFVRRMRDEGGRIELYIQLAGNFNFGDTLAANLLTTIAAIPIDISIEVFPVLH